MQSWRSRRGRVGVKVAMGALGVIASAAGCASVLGIDSDRHLATTDSGAPPPAATADANLGTPTPDANLYTDLPANWACLNDAVPDAGTGNVQLQLFFNDVANGGTPIAGAEVHWCNQLDLTCTNAFDSVTTDDGGIATLTVPVGFDGYYEVRATNYSPSILSRTPQLSSESQPQGTVNIAVLSSGASLVGVQQDPNLAIAIVGAADCTTTPAAGITFQVGAPGATEQVLYLADNYPSKSATKTDSVTGSAIIFNVPPGTFSVTASFASNNEAIRTATTIARQGWITFVQIRPDQASHTPL